MKNQEKASLSIIKIICVSIILILLSGIGTMAVNAGTVKMKDVKIELQNGYEMTVMTSKEKVSEVLNEKNILIKENQKVIPGLEEKINDGSIIKIVDKSYNEVKIAEVSKKGIEASVDELMKNYAPITEKIVVEQVEIPFETITKNVSGESKETQTKVIKNGKNGLKEVTYKVKYQNDIEIDKIILSEKIINEPINKVVQVNKKASSRGRHEPRTTNTVIDGQVYKVTAYCPCSKCCGKSNGITSSGRKATAGRTVAASSKFPIGTKLNIGGHIYTVEDRGGAIQGNRIDVFVNSHSQALSWGVKYMPVSVVK